MREWADAGADVYVYFDNDMKVRAPYDGVGAADTSHRLMRSCIDGA